MPVDSKSTCLRIDDLTHSSYSAALTKASEEFIGKTRADSCVAMAVRPLNITFVIYTILLCIIIVYVIYLLLYGTFDYEKYAAENDKLAEKLSNNKMQALINGSGINNIPSININTTNPTIKTANDCGKGPVFIGTNGTNDDCIRICINSNASVINVAEHEEYIYDSSGLQVGAHCILGPRPLCNMLTSYAMLTVNSVVCHTKYPEIVGGEYGTQVVACTNNLIQDPQNYLWDYKSNTKYDVYVNTLTDVDEVMSDGNYRFRCKFNGTDVRENLYIEHPDNRFHPFRNYCASEVFAAHPDVRTVIDRETQSYVCDCGDYEITRVRNIDPNDPTSICSNLTLDVKIDVRNRKLLTVPYKCFTLFSPVSDVGIYLPCPNDQFTRRGSQFSAFTMPFSENPNALIEHPVYKDFNDHDYGVYVPEGEIV